MLAGLSGLSSARYDLNGAAPLSRTYIIAASYRSGSTHLCTRLWQTGRLGAPFEYLNHEHEMKFMYSRLGARSADDYLDRLIACRKSDNGVFGLKAHFPHFRAALRSCPTLLQRLAPVQFIFIRRRDKVAQAVSLAKAYQTRAWLSLDSCDRAAIPLFYSREFIAACLAEIRRQEASWEVWFDTQLLQPHEVHYEDLVSNEDEVVSTLCRLMRVDNEPPGPCTVPVLERQFDATNLDWITRFKAELGLD